MNKTTMAVSIAAALTLAAGLSGCTTEHISSGSKPRSSSVQAAKASQAPVAKPGSSYATAVPLGTVISGKDAQNVPFSYSLGSVTFDATSEIAGYNQFNDAPNAGYQYLAVAVTITNGGTQSTNVQDTLAFGIDFMTPDGKTVAPSTDVVTPNPLDEQPDTPAGGTTAGTIVFEVPAGTTSGAFVQDNLFEAAQ